MQTKFCPKFHFGLPSANSHKWQTICMQRSWLGTKFCQKSQPNPLWANSHGWETIYMQTSWMQTKFCPKLCFGRPSANSHRWQPICRYPGCERSFTRKCGRIVHERSHSDEQPFVGRLFWMHTELFVHRTHLHRHRLTPSGEKSYIYMQSSWMQTKLHPQIQCHRARTESHRRQEFYM